MLSKPGLRIFLFLLAFTLEVRIAKAAFEEPRGCLLSKAENCAVKTGDEKFTLKFPNGEIVLDQSTAVILSEKKLVLVNGTVWVRAHGPVTVSTEFGDAKSSGEFWVSRSTARMNVSAVSETVELTPRGASEALSVDPGLENYVSGVQKDGTAETGLPIAIPFSEHVTRWARLFTGKKADFEDQVDRFHATWV
ncbi:MAG TPA: hypothetical protein VM432_01830, partial [Bdellovibrionales bacterium]|nr:hypothetical protein [Bdellovibrionales bacterium]